MITEGSCQLIWAFYLQCISQNTFYFIYYAAFLGIIATIMTFFIPESPRYLYGANNLKGCSDVLQLIAKMNGVVGYDLPKFEPEYQIIVSGVDEDYRVSEGPEFPRQTTNANGEFDSLLSERDKTGKSIEKKLFTIQYSCNQITTYT